MKNNRSAKYHLGQILYEFAVEVTNRFKRLDLVNSVPEDLWTEVHNVLQEMVKKIIPKKKKSKKATWLSEEVLQKLKKGEKPKTRERGKGISN